MALVLRILILALDYLLEAGCYIPNWKICLVQEDFEDTKGVIKIRKSKKDRQHNGQKKKDKNDI